MVQQSTGQGKLLSSLSSGLLSLFTFQLIARLLTFGLNVFIARTIDRAAFGVGSVQVKLSAWPNRVFRPCGETFTSGRQACR